MHPISTKTFLIASAFTLGLAACGDDSDNSPGASGGSGMQSDDKTITEIAAEDGSFTTLVSALQATGLDEVLAGEDTYTVFAPTDDAFARLPSEFLANASTEDLATVLTYHVVAGKVMADEVIGYDAATTVEGSDVAISFDGESVYLNGATMVTATDIEASNGVIHVIDSVILPEYMDFPGDIVDAAMAYPVFDSLVGAVASAELVDALRDDNMGDGYTVFAPTNGAFAAIAEVAAGLTIEQLTNVLLYHVVPGTYEASDVVSIDAAPTLETSEISIEVTMDGVMLNGSTKVIWTDIRTANGVIHVIDTVLLP